MTEDDTFRVLSRTPYLQLEDLYVDFCGNDPNSADPGKMDEFLASHNWTWDEFYYSWTNNPIRKKDD
jgi:hypothetical protein